MNAILQTLDTSALVTAIETNLHDLFQMFRYWSQAELHDEVQLLWTITDIPFPMFNSGLRARLGSSEVDVALEAIIARYRSRNVPMLWWTGPNSTPTNLGAHLEEHGFVHEEDATGMAVDLQTLNEDVPIPTGFTIEKVNDIASLREWFRPFLTGFGVPHSFAEAFIDLYDCAIFSAQMPIQAYTGWVNGEPVASSTVYYGGGVAGIYDVATIPAARRQGIGALITLAPLRDARAMGYRVGVLHSSKMGSNVYRRLGFRPYCAIGQYVWSPENEE